jgi:hypothetical protein
LTWLDPGIHHTSSNAIFLMDCRVKPCNDDITDGSRMRRKSAPFRLALVLAALTLSACAQRNQAPFDSALNEDDDTFCRAGGKVAVGSAEYAACRKDRDAQRSNAIARADKKQRDFGEYMLNNPVRP